MTSPARRPATALALAVVLAGALAGCGTRTSAHPRDGAGTGARRTDGAGGAVAPATVSTAAGPASVAPRQSVGPPAVAAAVESAADAADVLAARGESAMAQDG